ncbi:MAG: tetratricopeptide repeat protein [Myxococcales bacterium]
MVPSVLAELQRRRVFRTLIAYGVAAFGVLQIIEPVMHGLHWPDATLSYVVMGLGLGFPIVIVLAWIFDVNAGRIERTTPGLVRGRVAAVALAGVSVLAAAPGLAWYLYSRPRTSLPARAPGSLDSAPSIAVLPLVNLSSDKEQEYFSDGLSEELLNLLGRLPGLRVAARTSAFAFKGQNVDAREIGRKLGVAAILEGSVRKSGDRIRISTELVDAADGYHLWSETYDRQLTDVFAVQDEIARAVVSALKVKLLAPPASMERRTTIPEAFDQYLLGTQAFHRNSVEGFKAAKDAYQKAVALDPGYAPAWAGLALATYWVSDSSDTLAAVKAGQDRAVTAAEKAIALRPDLPDGYLARGFVRVPIQWDWEGSRADLERALALKPNDPDALYSYANAVLRPLGRKKEAIAVARRAAELDPLNARAWTGLGSVLALDGQLAAAREAYNRSLEISPDQSFTPFQLGVTFLLDGQAERALAVFQRSTNEIFRLAGVALAENDLGRRKKSQRALDEAIARFGHNGAYQIAQVYAWRGETDRAVYWLERARDQRDGGLVLSKVDPLLQRMRDDPRYLALLRKVHLPLD